MSTVALTWIRRIWPTVHSYWTLSQVSLSIVAWFCYVYLFEDVHFLACNFFI